jgi:hypothetical protein
MTKGIINISIEKRHPIYKNVAAALLVENESKLIGMPF